MNVRLPERAMGDLRAQIAAVKTGEKRFMEMIQKYGCDEVLAAIAAIMDQSEASRARGSAQFPTASMRPNRSWTTTASPLGKRIPIRVKVDRRGDRMTIDLTDVSTQVAGLLQFRRDRREVAAARSRSNA